MVMGSFTETIGKSFSTPSGYMRIQPRLTSIPRPQGLLVPWMRMLGALVRKAYCPKGLSGPAGTTAGRGSRPSLARSA